MHKEVYLLANVVSSWVVHQSNHSEIIKLDNLLAGEKPTGYFASKIWLFLLNHWPTNLSKNKYFYRSLTYNCKQTLWYNSLNKLTKPVSLPFSVFIVVMYLYISIATQVLMTSPTFGKWKRKKGRTFVEGKMKTMTWSMTLNSFMKLLGGWFSGCNTLVYY